MTEIKRCSKCGEMPTFAEYEQSIDGNHDVALPLGGRGLKSIGPHEVYRIARRIREACGEGC